MQLVSWKVESRESALRNQASDLKMARAGVSPCSRAVT